MIRALALAACLLTVCITAASAFIRHWQAGTGCYGSAVCMSAQATGDTAAGAAPAGPAPAGADDRALRATPRGVPTPLPVVLARAAHRLAAMLVGVLAILLAVIGWSRLRRGERIAAVLALALTLGLAWLGRHTPSPLPLVTLGNVVGGFALAATFGWIAVGSAASSLRTAGGGPRTGALAWTALALLALVAAAGVMVFERGALDACRALLCIPAVSPAAEVFDPRVERSAGDVAGAQALHLLHRALAVAFAAFAVLAAARALAHRALGRRWLLVLVGAACAQALVGAAIAGGSASPALSSVHNAVAAGLAAVLAAIARRAGTTDEGAR